MNQSLVITRYARTLLKFVQETGHGAVVCSEADVLERAIFTLPELKRMIEAKDVVPAFDKKKLLQAALGNKMSPELSRFIGLVLKNGRDELLSDILRDFIDMYNKCQGIRRASLVCATEPSPWLIQRIRALVKSKTGDDTILEVQVDPALIGGFVLDTYDYLLDASVKRRLDLMKEAIIEQNRRII